MPPKGAKPKAPMASSSGAEDATLQEEVESLRRQLAESEARTATLQATIEETPIQDTPALTDFDYKCIAAAIQERQSTSDRRRSPTAALSESTRRSPKQPDPPLLSNRKDLTYTS